MNIENNVFRMPRFFRRVGVTALAVTLLAGTATPGAAAADSRAVPRAAAGQDRPELQEAIQSMVDSGFAGVQLRVHDERGDWVGSAGVRKLGEIAKPPTDGRFRIGSNTKTFVATLVLQLVAEGKVGLDTSASDYLPEFGLDRRITVRMLLQHTSGLFSYTGEYYPDGTIVPGIPWQGQEWVDNRFHTYQPEELVRLALSKPARFAPGTDWNYSNTNYVLAALLIEKVTGRPYSVEMHRRILRPLGLSGTVVPGSWPGIPGPHAHAYYRYENAGQWKTLDITRQNVSWASGAGEMISTTRDLHTFFAALVGGRLLPPRLLAEMRKPHPKSGIYGYGLGLMVQDAGPNCAGTILTHNGGLQGFGALMYTTPDGSRTLEASMTTGDSAFDAAEAFQKAQQRLVNLVFCGGRTGAAAPVIADAAAHVSRRGCAGGDGAGHRRILHGQDAVAVAQAYGAGPGGPTVPRCAGS
ncbi:alkaline D-peptidase [Actinoplanes sp. ATCC 53533]|uniref:serine hydrolase domain-containing protein n=1 Tax=Actinoplanes sp. ATCC 53533 TaxID=1288362 RepID=UPI000F7A63D2|nr:serine hydrolase domain-containing protein [Actinoplanes sp. ATCC 53533]RSM37683.1 alkaline D-peptidase [Actinoplanes sp. ATCC 53533]